MAHRNAGRLVASEQMASLPFQVDEFTYKDPPRRSDVQMASDNDEVKKLRAEAVKLLNLASDPKTTN
jgi:hypothetical protein